eukprot:GHVH01004465.1.p1 GENE.GHVH01004465.1~~GHVH01004465.1.p1  ORF type:complete len:111 (+),score=14.16 GHVH01004465.1:68-400(+)
MGYVASGRVLDGSIWAMILFFLSGFSLSILQHVHGLTARPEVQQYPSLVSFLKKLFPFKKFDYNLTHIVLFAILIAMMSLRPECEFEDADAKRNKKKKVPKSRRVESDSE